jgi:cbb3-type cytochrome oxidase maturation protein
MSVGEVFFIGWSLLMVIICVIFFVWGWESGQFKHIEKAKFDMLQEKEPQSWPGRKKKNKDTTGVKEEPGENGGNL